jgi:predicted O-linked N-acetylglucosamine transferase (SPINDLY family)
LALNPASAVGLCGFAVALTGFGHLDGAGSAFRRSMALTSEPGEAYSHYLFFLCYLPEMRYSQQFRENRRWGRLIERQLPPPPPFGNPRDPERRIRLAYVSPEIRGDHNQLAWLLPLLENHDRDRFHVTVYADIETPDRGTALVEGLCDRLRIVGGSDEAVQAACIRDDRPDIAVNLCGWIASKRALFARRLAPIQVAYDNHVTTTGLAAVDVRITDRWMDPPGVEPYFTETLVRLESGYAAHRRPPAAPDATDLPALARGYVTFGSFNQIPKLGPEVVRLWSNLVNAVPGSRLLIKSLGLDDPYAVTEVRRRFSDAGLDPARIDFLGAVPDLADHFRRIAAVDIALDSFPFAGGKTTCDALWMSVPVVTRRGDSLIQNVGVSLLTRAGLPELIAANADDYRRIAVDLAHDIPRLAELRRGLRARLDRSTLYDGRRHTREFESVLRRLWRDWCATPSAVA